MGAPVLFPNSPTLNQLHPTPAVAGLPVYRWDGEKWTIQAAPQAPLSQFYISDTPPAGAAEGAFWWDSSAGLLYVRYNDGTSTQWVSASPLPDLSAFVRGDVAQALSAAQQAQARSNMYAAPFDAMAYSGLQINGACEISQERGSTSFSLTSATRGHIQDGWDGLFVAAATLAVTGQPATTNAPAGFQNSVGINASTGLASLAAGDYALLMHHIEGFRIAKLAWGTANAQPITIGFWIISSVAGTATVSVRNGATNRSYVVDVAVTATWQFVTVTVPGDTGGTWAKDNTIGLVISFCVAAGSSIKVGTPTTWTATGNVATAATSNLFATTGNTVLVTGLTVLPGTQAPTAAQSPLIMRPYADELLQCQRYYRRTTGEVGTEFTMYAYAATGGANFGQTIVFPVPMRIAPTIDSSGTWAAGNCTGFYVGGKNTTSYSPYVTSTTTANISFQPNGSGRISFDARL